ncbi:hypothetical protein MNEG_8022 [Monoraphidium neglectum]|uniref:Uncharacterized protein n=1 Tax=Monoraphidium neglectum TaxID=145388 RepID=A0A0D2M9E5_9CHLO|nr:hypothetical protein MNEG_8022 [Monoraphidium neglectum]KIY99939.1 hypothetical protein MNEG_8022 [Monoraphidium neglectum]|eukprot:XP_013898959.1 hypothetical protein MNEG_8022 [Monoraphidium neglectum]
MVVSRNVTAVGIAENENKALRDEVSRLRAALGGAGLQAPFKLQAAPAAAAALASSS